MKLKYTGIRVRDLKRSINFYTKTMGLKEVQRGKMRAGGVFVQLRDEETTQILELNYYPPESKFYEEYVEGSELDHLAFWCKDVRKSYERVLTGGRHRPLNRGMRVDTRWRFSETQMGYGLN